MNLLCQLTSRHTHVTSIFFLVLLSSSQFHPPSCPSSSHTLSFTRSLTHTLSSTMASNILISKADALTILTVSCFAPKAPGEFTQLSLSINPSYGCSWTCTLTNRAPQLNVSLVWTIPQRHERNFLPPSGVQSLRIVSRNGTMVLSAPVNGITNGATMTGTSCVYVKIRVDDMNSQRKYPSNVTLSSSSS